jgi:hypothetical protein
MRRIELMDQIGPDTEQLRWRDLFGALQAYRGDLWSDDLILPWASRHFEVFEELRAIGRPESRRARIVPGSDRRTALEGLYALSRVLDVLIAPYQPVNDDPAVLNPVSGQPWWTGPLPDTEALLALAAAIDGTLIAQERFHPFFHEIVAVEPAHDPDAEPDLVDEVWPGFLVNSLLLVRAGVVVRAGANVLNPLVASRSALYWAWWRRNRVTTDLSHGSGGSFQWGTEFRRDYWVDGGLHYNVDADRHMNDAAQSAAVQAELVRFRCSVLVDHGADQWPWGQGLVEPYPPPPPGRDR